MNSSVINAKWKKYYKKYKKYLKVVTEYRLAFSKGIAISVRAIKKKPRFDVFTVQMEKAMSVTSFNY